MSPREVTTMDLDAQRWLQLCRAAHLIANEDGEVLLVVWLADSVDLLDGLTPHERAGLRGEHSDPPAPKVRRVTAIWDANYSQPVTPLAADVSTTDVGDTSVAASTLTSPGNDGRASARAVEIGDANANPEPWQPIAEYPNRGVPPWVEVRTADGTIYHGAHYATSDGQGEQPAFANWFFQCGAYNYRAMETPTHFRYR